VAAIGSARSIDPKQCDGSQLRQNAYSRRSGWRRFQRFD
jgi:hypothetical protein